MTARPTPASSLAATSALALRPTPAQTEAVRQALTALPEGDAAETAAHAQALRLLDAGADLLRETVDRPDPHLVSYALVTDGRDLLLCHHRKAGLWLPLGGHLEPGESPHGCALRELAEELGTALPLISDAPVFLTCQRTRGPRPHRDLSLWFLAQGDRNTSYAWDSGEFLDLAWHSPEALPPARDPNLDRCVAKLRALGHLAAEGLPT